MKFWNRFKAHVSRNKKKYVGAVALGAGAIAANNPTYEPMINEILTMLFTF